MCGISRICERAFVVSLFTAFFFGPPDGIAREPDGYNRADFVCVGRVDDTKTLQVDPANRWDLLRSTTFTVTTVLKGDTSMANRQIAVQWPTRMSGPMLPPYFRERGAYYVAALEENGALFSPVLGTGGYKVTSRTLTLPDEAPLREKINLIRLATIRDCPDDNIAVSLALSGLIIEGATADSPYYDLLEEYIRLEEYPDLLARCQALYARLRLGDVTALPAAMDHATSEPWLSARLPQVLQTFGDDAVTTLCLITDGKILSQRKKQAVEALRRMAPPAALPTLIRALDDPNREVRYHAYAAIEKIRGAQWETTFADFEGSTNGQPDEAHTQILVDQMKEWWETEGRRQFDYVLPKEK